jgi:polysaccharide biosynthesis protein PslH
VKLLFVTPYLPSPPTFGGQRRLHGLLRELARDHDVSLVSMVDPGENVERSVRATLEHCKSVVTIPAARLAAQGRKKRLLQLGSLLSARSYEGVIYDERAMQTAVDQALARERFDVVQVEFAQMALYARSRDRRGPRYCLDEHNVEYDVVRRTADGDVSLLRRAYSAANWRKLRAEERRAWRAFDGTVVTSARDEEMLREDVPGARTAVVPNGVDVDAFVPDGSPVDPGSVLFFGAINYFPNVDALHFFLREVWPQLKASRPDARLRIVGPKPPPSIATWPDPAVHVMGYVDDVRPHIARASVVIAPLRIGGGTRLKVLEAMSLGKAIVSTSLGAEGLEVTHERDILLADDPRALAEQIARVMADPSLAARLGEAARKRVVDRYSWRASVDRLVAFYEELLRA